MKKREQGILTVEASIVLTLFTLFVLFLFSFARVYRAQNMVSHAALQAADSMALESYLRENALDEKAEDVVYLASRITGSTTLSADSFQSLRSANIPSIAKEKFISAVSNSEATADEKLKKLGVKNGLAGIDFSASTMDLDKDDVVISITYTVEMQFPIFGANEITVTKSARAKTFGEILFEVITEPENPTMGSTSGGGSYQHGKTVQIVATPNYGYKFVSWDDGNTDNPRTVTVNEAQKYVAKFTEDSFGITVKANPESYGTVSGGNTYTYLSTANISATPNTGYSFVKWSIYKHKDSSTSFSTEPNIQQTVDQSYTFTANFEPNPYNVSVEYECSGNTPNVSVVETNNTSNKGKSITVKYGNKITISAPAIDGYAFKGWKKKGTNSIVTTSYSSTMTMPASNITYVAVYEMNYSISITNGSVGNHSLTFEAITTPSNAVVDWSISGNQQYYSLSVDSSTHKATLTINDSKVDYNSMSVSKTSNATTNYTKIVGTVYSEVTVTATIRNNTSFKASKTAVIEPTAQVFYYMYRKDDSIYRYYYNYEVSNPWKTYKKNTGCFYRIWSVKYSDYVKCATTASNGRYYGNSGDGQYKQGGKNMASIAAKQIRCPKELVGGYNSEVLAYLNGSVKGEKNGSGYYDYYFSRVK